MGINFFKKPWFIILAVVVLVILFLVIAYASGSKVVNEPEIQWVSHTEYWSGGDASTIVRLVDYKGRPIEGAACTASIFRPDGSIFVSGQPMQASAIAGNFERKDSRGGQPVGTYQQEVTCVYGGNTIRTSESFHVNPALENIREATTNLSLLRNELSNVNISVSALVTSTGESINLKIDSTRTNLTELMRAVESSIISDIGSTKANLTTQLSSINVSL